MKIISTFLLAIILNNLIAQNRKIPSINQNKKIETKSYKNQSKSSFSSTENDIDNDGVNDSEDNCKYMFNPLQEDNDKNGIGDICELSPILLKKSISVLEDIDSGYSINTSIFLTDSVKSNITYGDGDYKSYITLISDKIIFKKKIISYPKEFFNIPVQYRKPGIVIDDTIKIRLIRYVNWQKKTGKLQNGYIPYYYETLSNGITGQDNNIFGPTQIFTLANQSNFFYQDIDNNGMIDIIGQTTQLYYPPISDTSRNHEMVNIQRIGIPFYLRLDKNFNIKSYHENFRDPDVLLHHPDFYGQIDINNDGKKELINFGEHYHTDASLFTEKGLKILKNIGLIKNKDFNEWGAKLNRYYTIENGRLIDKKDSIDNSLLLNAPFNFENFVSIFGSAIGDIDNDGDIDIVESVQSNKGYSIDILTNTGTGFFKAKRIYTDKYDYKTGPEGENILIDINADGYLDLLFGGSRCLNCAISPNVIGFILNDKKGSFRADTPSFMENDYSNFLGNKYVIKEDLNKDGKNEIIVYRSTGLGTYKGSSDKSYLNEILVYTVDNGSLINRTKEFIDTLSNSKMYSGSSCMYYIDIDGDKIKDLFIRYFTDNKSQIDYWPFYGFWEKDYSGCSYFKGTKSGRFIYTRLGHFSYQDGFSNFLNDNARLYFNNNMANYFQPYDLDGDGTAELIHSPISATGLLIFKLYECQTPKLISEKNMICDNDSISIKLTNKIPGSSYTWYLDNNIISSSVDSIFLKKAGTIKVKSIDSLGCSKISDSITYYITSRPSTPAIIRDSLNNLSSSSITGNIWYYNDVITGDTARVIKPKNQGYYSVKSSQNGCSSDKSISYYYLTTNIDNFISYDFINIFPNPFVNELRINFIINKHPQVNLEIINPIDGSKVFSQNNISSGANLTLGKTLPKGTYILKITSVRNYQTLKQIKLIRI